MQSRVQKLEMSMTRAGSEVASLAVQVAERDCVIAELSVRVAESDRIVAEAKASHHAIRCQLEGQKRLAQEV